jgi:hypothetical protein
MGMICPANAKRLPMQGAVCVQRREWDSNPRAVRPPVFSRELARAMSGDLTVHSVVDEGSTFTVHLPAAEPADPSSE